MTKDRTSIPRTVATILVATVLGLTAAPPAQAWKNGPPHNKVTNSERDCAQPPYSTHDWIADHARALLPADARDWLAPHRNLFLIGTEAPDYAKIEIHCGAPNRGYNDTGQGRHDLRFDDRGNVVFDLPAARAEEEYAKATDAFRDGNAGHAAYFLGAAIHYIGDLSQYGHAMKGETHHADFEDWVGARTPSFAGGGTFEKFIRAETLIPIRAYDAVIGTGRVTRQGEAPVLAPEDMDARFDADKTADAALIASVGHCLNTAANAAAGMLLKFYREVVAPARQP